MTAKRAAIWARISTQKESQARSLESQLARLRVAAAERGYEVVMEYAHRDMSGWATGKGLDAAIDGVISDSAAIGFNALMVTSVDRLSRGGVLYTLGVIKRLDEAGVRFVSVDSGANIDMGTPEGELILAAYAAIARLFSENHSARVKEGMLRARERGVRLGRPPKKRRSRVIGEGKRK